MKKHLSFLGAVLTAGVLAVPAYAADSSYYVSGDAGVSLFSNITPKDPTQIQQGTLTTSAGIDVLGAVGMKFDSWRVEGEFGYQRNNAKQISDNTGLTLNATGNISVTSLLANGYYDFIAGGVNPYLSAGMAVTTAAFLLTGLIPIPSTMFSMPPSIEPIFMKINVQGAMTWGFAGVITSVLVMDFVDTMGTLFGLSSRANLLDEEDNLPEIEKPMLVDALSTIAASMFGTTTAGVYIESAAGIEQGGKTGFTALVVAALFALALFFSPILTIVPPYACGPALVVVGMFMMQSVTKFNFNDYSELLPAFLTIVLMIFTFNIGVGITAGFIAYVILKIFTGKAREVRAGMWILALFSFTFYLFYPYH